MKRSEKRPDGPNLTLPVPLVFTPTADGEEPAHVGGTVPDRNWDWAVIHERVPFTERERALARRLGISLQGALSVTNIVEICRIGLTVDDPQFRADCAELIATLEKL